MACNKSICKRKVHSDKYLLQERRNFSHKRLNFVPQGTRKNKIWSVKLVDGRK